MEHNDFKQVVQEAWNQPVHHIDKAKVIMAKFKILRKTLKEWVSDISNLSITINNTKMLLNFVDVMEETRDLTVQEWNFRELLQRHLQDLLHKQKIYWNQRGYIKWVKFGDAPTFIMQELPTYVILLIFCYQILKVN